MPDQNQAGARSPSLFKSVVVAGTGAVGSAVCLRLAQRGYRRVLLVDPDVVAPRNLSLSPFLQQAWDRAAPKDNSVFKAPLLVAEVLHTFRLHWASSTCEIADVGLGTLSTYDALCCCTDSALSRIEASWIARRLGIAMVDCGVFPDGLDEGRVTCFGTQTDAPCYLCGLSEDRRAQLLAYSLSASLGCTPPLPDTPMTGTASAAEQTADEAVALLDELQTQPAHASAARRLRRTASTGQWTTEKVTLQRNVSCPFHEAAAETVALSWQVPLRQTLLAHPGRVVQLDWPLCTAAVCRTCGTTAAPLRRVAWVRRSMPCPRCRLPGTMDAVASVSSIAGDDALARHTPQQLNLPEQHLYTLRKTFTLPASGDMHHESTP